MPTYDYRCEACRHELEIFQPITEAPKRKCPACGKSKLKRIIGRGAGIIFKGSGFYQTDYRSASYRKGQQAESKPEAKPEAGGAKEKADGGTKTPPSSERKAAAGE